MGKTLYIMQGVPGSGKSTFAEMIREKTHGVIFSTDDYWYETTNEWGQTYRGETYNFNGDKLGIAHRWNQKRCLDAMLKDRQSIIIDNTNIKRKDAQVYKDLAALFDYDVQIVRVEVPLEIAIARQADRSEDRRIPEAVIKRMHETMERLV